MAGGAVKEKEKKAKADDDDDDDDDALVTRLSSQLAEDAGH